MIHGFHPFKGRVEDTEQKKKLKEVEKDMKNILLENEIMNSNY
jgi:hypothetical protein